MIYTDIKQLQESDKQYFLILSDPPWKQSKGGKQKVRPNTSGTPLDYPTLSLDEIKEHLQITTQHCKNNAVLFLWTIERYLIDAQQLAEELGWKLHMRLIWDKGNGKAPSFDIRYGHEYLLYMYRGKFISVAKDVRGKYTSVFREGNAAHSTKPEIAFKIIESLYPEGNKLEMYARQIRLGWDQFGNELEQEGGVVDEFNKDESSTS